MMEALPPELEQLCRQYGVQTSYEDVYRRTQVASTESVLAVLRALGAEVSSLEDVPRVLASRQLGRLERGVEPVLVQWDGEPIEFDVAIPQAETGGTLRCELEQEGDRGRITETHDLRELPAKPTSDGRFVLYRVPLPRLEWGYHRLSLRAAGRHFQSLVITAPRRAYTGDAAPGGDWGCFLPLYALRSERNWGVGDFRDLQDLLEWTESVGGDIVGTLPLLAAFLDEPCEPSPYAPASRLAWNEFYIDLAQVPELAECPAAADLLNSSGFQREIARLRDTRYVEYRETMALKRRALEMLAASFFEREPPDRYREYQQFLEQNPHVDDYATFRAVQRHRGEPWHQWPQTMRAGRLSEDDYDIREKQYHLYAQWIATSQLESLAAAAGGGLYLDLPLGIRPDGYDVWRWRDAYALSASAGSPPDAMWTKGQDWGFPPLHPERIREQGYGHVRDYLRHHLRLSRLLRIDHVMQLHRLYWIPHGLGAHQGCYVAYNHDEFYAILNLESHRCCTALVGENLGTVPPAVDQAMEQHNMQQMYVVQYEVAALGNARDEPETVVAGQQAGASASANDSGTTAQGSQEPPVVNEVTPGSLASLNTHDMPSFASWWRGLDIELRQDLGLIDEQQAREARKELDATRVALVGWLRSEGWLAPAEQQDVQVLTAILKFLAASDAGVVLVNLEDMWLETEPQNVPGTGPERPNWRRRAALSFEEWNQRPEILSVFQTLSRLRNEARARQNARERIQA